MRFVWIGQGTVTVLRSVASIVMGKVSGSMVIAICRVWGDLYE